MLQRLRRAPVRKIIESIALALILTFALIVFGLMIWAVGIGPA